MTPSRARRVRRDDRGELAANTAVLLPVMLLLFTCLQFGLWFFGRQAAASAAQHAADAARVETGTPAAGEAAFDQYVSQVSGLEDASVAVARTDQTVTVTVTGSAISIVGFLDPAISVTVEAPVERVTE